VYLSPGSMTTLHYLIAKRKSTGAVSGGIGRENLNNIEIRATKNSLQILIENLEL